MPVKELSWTPIRIGNTYCSPACGAGCKWSEYQKAMQQAKALAKRLGSNWKPVVSENMGWFWHADCGVCRVYPGGSGKDAPRWVVFLNTNPQFLANGDDPVKAVRAAVAELDAHVASLQKQRAELRLW